MRVNRQSSLAGTRPFLAPVLFNARRGVDASLGVSHELYVRPG